MRFKNTITCDYLPSFGASPPFHQNQITLLGDGSICMSVSVRGLHRAKLRR